MKNIRKFSGKITALAVALSTTVALMSPYDANATSRGNGGGGGEACGWTIKFETCHKKVSKANSGSGQGSFFWSPFKGASGSGKGEKDATVTEEVHTRSYCKGGTARACTFSDPCTNAFATYICNPNCTVTVK